MRRADKFGFSTVSCFIFTQRLSKSHLVIPITTTVDKISLINREFGYTAKLFTPLKLCIAVFWWCQIVPPWFSISHLEARRTPKG